MQIFIPTIGTVLTLADDWTFDLYEEHRNDKFANQAGLEFGYNGWSTHRWVQNADGTHTCVPPRSTPVTLPQGTVLKVDRIYIRGKTDDARAFDSVTFFCNPGARKGPLKGRFWAKLSDVNQMDVLMGDPGMGVSIGYTGPA